jgi:hypothetical protein
METIQVGLPDVALLLTPKSQCMVWYKYDVEFLQFLHWNVGRGLEFVYIWYIKIVPYVQY